MNRLLLVGTIAISSLIMGCTDKREPTSTHTLQKEDIKIAVFHHILSTSFVAAQIEDQNGQSCFDKAGLNPLLNKRSKGPEVVDAIVSGSVEFGTLAITPQVFQILQGVNLTTFTTYQTSALDIKFVANKSAGITTPNQMKNKRIGYVGGTYGEIFLERYIQKYGIPKKDIILTSGGPAYLRDLLINGELDGAILWEPVVQDLLLADSSNIDKWYIDVDQSIYTARVNLLATPDVLKENKSKAKKLVQALICSEQYLIEQPKLVQTRLEKWLDRPTGSLTGVFHPETFRVTYDEKSLRADLKAESEWAKSAVFNNKVTIPTDFAPYITDEVLKQVNPERIITSK